MDLKDETVLVTGGSGFLGSFVCEELHVRGVEPIYVPRSSEYNLTQPNHIKQVFIDYDPSVVIHLAAVVGGIGANRDNPGKFFYENLVMGTHLLEEARKAKVKKFTGIGTVCSYPEETPVPFQEEDLWEGYPEETNAPYGLAKKMILVQSQAYREQYNFNSIHLIPVNLYGPRDNFNLETSHVIPAMVRKFIDAQTSNRDSVPLWGTGSPGREFLYVEDAAEAIVTATAKYDSPEPVNLGSGEEITIDDLAGLIQDLTGFEGEIEWDPSKPDGQPRRCLDTSRAKEKFGFEAEITLEEGLQTTIDWFESHRGSIEREPKLTGFNRTGVPDYLETQPE